MFLDGNTRHLKKITVMTPFPSLDFKKLLDYLKRFVNLEVLLLGLTCTIHSTKIMCLTL